MVSYGELCSNVAMLKARSVSLGRNRSISVEIGRKGRSGRKWQEKDRKILRAFCVISQQLATIILEPIIYIYYNKILL